MSKALAASFCLPGTKSYERRKHDVSAGLSFYKQSKETIIEEQGGDAPCLWSASREKTGISAAPLRGFSPCSGISHRAAASRNAPFSSGSLFSRCLGDVAVHWLRWYKKFFEPFASISHKLRHGLIRGNIPSSAGLTISAKFRRNFGNFFVSASYRDSKFRYFSVYFVFKFKIQQISTEIQRNSPKFTEISERNSVSAKHRDLTGKRNG